MKKTVDCIAVDLGASGGKVILGRFNGNTVSLQEVYRFPNGIISVRNSMYWDVLRLFDEIKKGLRKAVYLAGSYPASLGIDTWGNDFCLLDKQGNLIENPHAYRDPRTNGVMKKAFRLMPRAEIYRHTGIQFMQTNTLYQLYSMVLDESPLFSIADTFLMIPDLFNYWFTGRKCCEFTDATTTQMANPFNKSWCDPILQTFNISKEIMAPLIEAGTRLGNVEGWLCQELGIRPLPVVAVGSHDTASAVSAIPAPAQGRAFLSSGTWSLLGAEVAAPLINEPAFKYNFSCYGGICNTFLVWKNIQGLWLLQECMRAWQEEVNEYTYDGLLSLAERCDPSLIYIDPDDRSFLAPGHFPSLINEYCLKTGQKPPEGKAGVVRCILESLAFKYRFVFDNLQQVLGQKLTSLYIVGGGSRNNLLNQLSADALGIQVLAGLPEATSLGNIMMQLISLGEVKTLQESRQIIRASFKLSSFNPSQRDKQEESYHRFLTIIARGNPFNM